MTFDGRVYASDVLANCHAENVFCGRHRAYPLAVDLGEANSNTRGDNHARDTRYPRIRLSEVVERGARAVLLPDEPYAFEDEDAIVFSTLGSPLPLVVERVDGKDLFWYGTRVAAALPRLRDQIARMQAACVGS